MARFRFSFASLVTAVLALLLLTQHGGASLESRDEEADASPLGPHNEEVMAITHKANSKMKLDKEPDAAWAHIKATYRRNIKAGLHGNCTLKNIGVRKEWGRMDRETQLSFIRACHCMGTLPAKTPHFPGSGVRNRWDDLGYAHMKSWRNIHFSTWTLPFHREMVWIMEQALRHECGYTGYMPYFEWPKYRTGRLDQFAIFDGSETSISGDGDHRSESCSFVTTGPMANWTVNLGPVPGKGNCIENPLQSGLGYNPRQVERRMNQSKIHEVSYEHLAATILNVDNINEFVLRIEAREVGAHSMPHMMIGGTQFSLPGSPGDWWFYLHHCMVDFMWSAWQMQDPAKRLHEIPTNPDEFVPFRRGWTPIPPLTLDTRFSVSEIFRTVTVRDVMSTTAGQYCYMYE